MSFDEVVNELVELTQLSENEVKERVWMEALNRTWNVPKAAKDFGVDFHIYNEKMEEFYRKTDAFIFELMVESCREGKIKVLEKIKERIGLMQKGRLNILMFGDGVGSDTIYLHSFFGETSNFWYFDIPESKTYEFAIKRFKKRGMSLKICGNIDELPQNFFDVIVCLEVLEHLPNPLELISRISIYLKNGGKVFITESFDSVTDNFPTHLKSNLRYSGYTPLLFMKNNLVLTYYPTEEPVGRPMEFTKTDNITFKEKVRIISKKEVIYPLMKHVIKNMLRVILKGIAKWRIKK